MSGLSSILILLYAIALCFLLEKTIQAWKQGSTRKLMLSIVSLTIAASGSEFVQQLEQHEVVLNNWNQHMAFQLKRNSNDLYLSLESPLLMCMCCKLGLGLTLVLLNKLY